MSCIINLYGGLS